MHFGEITISEQLDGLGASGVMTGTLNVTVCPASYAELVPKRAKVVISVSGGKSSFPDYYVSSRTVNDNNTCTFSCVDGMAKAETVIDDSGFNYDDKGLIRLSTALISIKDKCGFGGGISVDGAALTPYLSREKIHGRTGREILEELSAAWCGYWRVDAEDNVIFRKPEQSVTLASVGIYSKPVHCGSIGYNSVLMSDGKNTYECGFRADHCLSISTDYASQDAAGSAYERLNGYNYYMWQCAMCMLPGYIAAGTEFNFIGDGDRPEGYYLCNSITIKLCASGIFGSVGRNTLSEDEWTYRSDLERRLDAKQNKGAKVTVFVNHNA